jgi:hypothetical protein
VSFLSRQVRLESGESIVVVVGEDFDPHAEAGAYLKWLQYGAGRSPGTARTYGSRVAAYLTWAERSGIDWRCPSLDQLSDLVRWLHRGGRGADITPRTAGYVNLGLTAIGSFLRFCALHGKVPSEVADRLSEPRYLWHLPRGFDPGESGNRIVRKAALRMKAPARPPKVLTGTQQAAMVAATCRVRDRFLVELLFSTGIFSRGAKRTCEAFSCFGCSEPWVVSPWVRQVWWNSERGVCGLDGLVGRGASAPACGGVDLGHELAVGCAGCGELVAAFFELEAEVGGLLFEVGDLLAEGVDVGGAAESGFPPCLLAEGFGEPFLELLDAGAEAGRAFVGGEQVGLQR